MATATALLPGVKVLAFKLQEAMMQSDIRARLSDAINDAHLESGEYGYYIDHQGDDTGDAVYSCNGDVRMCSYEIATVGGKSAVNLDMDNSRNVVPTTTYQEEAEDEDNYSAMEEAGLYTKGPVPLCERFISKAERDKHGEEDFAGKGKSFPIFEPGDIMAAVRSIGRAGDKNVGSSTIKGRIIAIAKRKGWTKYLPKSWRGDESAGHVSGREGSGERRESTSLKLTESANTLETIVLKEARADYETKLIAPGKGSSAFYPKEVLQRDGPKVFKAGTHIYLNHPTAAEESARPEGDVKNLAGVLTTDAVYHESHAKGPGLYARMKVFADHAQIVEEKAAHVGMSIRASGVAESGKSRDGLPILKELTSAESVDVVTRAGAGGMILTESARGAANLEEVDMTEAEVKKLVESAVTAALAAVQPNVQRLTERELRADATVLATRILSTCTLHDASKQRVIEAAVKTLPKTTDGLLDEPKFTEIVNAESKREGQYVAQLTGTGVRGMGPGGNVVEMDPEKLREAEKRERKQAKRFQESETNVFAELMGNKDAAAFAVQKGA